MSLCPSPCWLRCCVSSLSLVSSLSVSLDPLSSFKDSLIQKLLLPLLLIEDQAVHGTKRVCAGSCQDGVGRLASAAEGEVGLQAWEEVADISGRLAIQNLMCNTLRAIYASNPEDLLPTMYLCTSCVAPAHAGIELGVGDAILVKVLPAHHSPSAATGAFAYYLCSRQ